jgi:hypothetical protein
MDSFSKYSERVRNFAGNAAKGLGSQETQKWLVGAVVIPVALFVLLSPGLLLNLPLNSKGRCSKLVPFGDTAAADACDDPAANNVEAICKARKKCASYFASGYTSVGPIFVHALVFVLLALIVSMIMRRQGLSA